MHKIGIFLITSCVLIICSYLWMMDPLHLSAPKDAELIDIFKRNISVFTELRDMAMSDGEGFYTEGSIPERVLLSRRTHYDELLLKIGSPTLVSGKSRIKWIYASGGMSTTGSEWTKGISFDLDCEAPDIKTTLDRFPTPTEESVYCRAIEKNWWVNVSIWP